MVKQKQLDSEFGEDFVSVFIKNSELKDGDIFKVKKDENGKIITSNNLTYTNKETKEEVTELKHAVTVEFDGNIRKFGLNNTNRMFLKKKSNDNPSKLLGMVLELELNSNGAYSWFKLTKA